MQIIEQEKIPDPKFSIQLNDAIECHDKSLIEFIPQFDFKNHPILE